MERLEAWERLVIRDAIAWIEFTLEDNLVVSKMAEDDRRQFRETESKKLMDEFKERAIAAGKWNDKEARETIESYWKEWAAEYVDHA